MLAPVLRLLAIYLCVGLAVFGFFKRDILMGMFSGDTPAPEHAAAPVALASSVAPSPEPAGQPVQNAQPAPAPVFAPLPDPAAPNDAPTAVPAKAPAQPQSQSQPPLVAQDFENQHNAARQAYWSGDKDTAIAAYKALLAQSPDSGALNGELGNIYYIMNQREQAGFYYEKAGQAALAAGNQAETSMMVGILRGLDPAAAQRLSIAQAAARQGAGQ